MDVINSETELKSVCHTSIVIDIKVNSSMAGRANTDSHKGATPDEPEQIADVSKNPPL